MFLEWAEAQLTKALTSQEKTEEFVESDNITFYTLPKKWDKEAEPEPKSLTIFIYWEWEGMECINNHDWHSETGRKWTDVPSACCLSTLFSLLLFCCSSLNVGCDVIWKKKAGQSQQSRKL